MKKPNYPIIQIVLIAAAFAVVYFFAASLNPLFTVNTLLSDDVTSAFIDGLYLYLGLFVVLLGFVFCPVLVLSIIRKNNLKIINKVFRVLVYISLLITTIWFILVSFTSTSTDEPGFFIVMIVISSLLIGALYTNYKFSGETTVLTKFINSIQNTSGIYLVLASVVLVIFFAIWQWGQAEAWTSLVQSNDGWYSFPWESRESIWSAYNMATKRILVFAGIVYSNIFMILYSLRIK